MIDGKTLNNMVENIAQMNCPICLATPTNVMKNEIEKFTVKNSDALHYGVSTCHFGMRCVDNLLHMGSFVGTGCKQYGRKSDQQKNQIAANLRRICDALAAHTGYE